MGSIFAYFMSLLLCVLLLLQSGQISRAHGHGHAQKGPSLQIFFREKDLKIGGKIPICFSTKDPSSRSRSRSRSPPLLTRKQSDSIPFSSSQLRHILDYFSISQGSPQAKAMEATLHHCEAKPISGETKFCATSLESMLDSTRGFFGLGAQFRALSTAQLTEPTKTQLQNYTVLGVPRVIRAPRFMGCHPLAYPYAVFYCHGQEESDDNRLYEVLLGGGGEDGRERVKAVGACHLDTSEWDPTHVAFRVLGTKPGGDPVCHFFPPDNLVWVPSPSPSPSPSDHDE